MIKVNFFQRRPRTGFNFSMEGIFEDIRIRLEGDIESSVFICSNYNDGLISKFKNIWEAKNREGKYVNHITGEVHFLNLLMKKKNNVLSILDCGMMERKSGASKEIVRWLYLKLPVFKASYVTAISNQTKNQIVKYTNCDPNKIKVIPVAISPRFIPIPKEFNKDCPNILHIGTGYNKNLERLIPALENLCCHLTIVGKLNENQVALLMKYNLNYSNVYNISNEEMLSCYQECDILSFISTFEGFGMPIIEANSVERVVITSNISSMPEVASNAACLVDPFDIKSIKNGFRKIIDNEDYRLELISNGRINKLRFNPDKIAKQYLDLYKYILNNI